MKAISMLPSGVGVTVEKLDKIYFSIECRMVFLFKSDAAVDYERMSGHKELREFHFDVWLCIILFIKSSEAQ